MSVGLLVGDSVNCPDLRDLKTTQLEFIGSLAAIAVLPQYTMDQNA